MCGLCGWQLRKADPRMATALGVLSVLMDDRGGDSYGYYDGEQVKKGLGKMVLNVNARELSGKSFVMAHCRLATHGAVVPQNSHPLIVGNILGAHNGIVGNHDALNSSRKRQFAVDSEHIFANIDQGLPLKEIRAYGAITYIDLREPSQLHLTRFNGGQLAMAALLEGDEIVGTVWASTKDALEAALSIAGFNFRLLYVKEAIPWIVQNGVPIEQTTKRMKFAEYSLKYWSGSWGNSYDWSSYGKVKLTNVDDDYHGDDWADKWTKKTAHTTNDDICWGCGDPVDNMVYVQTLGHRLCWDCINEYRDIENSQHTDEIAKEVAMAEAAMSESRVSDVQNLIKGAMAGLN